MSNEIKEKDDDEVVNFMNDFSQGIVSTPTILLTEFIAIYFVFYNHYTSGTIPETAVKWLLLFGEILLYMVGIIIALYVGFLFCTIIAGGIVKKLTYAKIVILIIGFIGLFLFTWNYFT